MRRKKKNKTRVCIVCGHEQGDDTYYYDAREHTTTADGRDICKNCIHCPVCEKRLRNPRQGRDGDVARCPKCQREYLRDVVYKRKTKVFERRNGVTYVPSLKQSKQNFKVKNWVRLEKEFETTAHGNAVRVIEVGVFDNNRGADDNYHLVSQSGYSYIRIDHNDENPVPKLKSWHPERHRVTVHPDSLRYYKGREVIERYTKKLRARGWKVVAVKDGNGRKDQVRWPEYLTIAQEKREEFKENFDEKAGARHRKRLEKIDDKYQARGINEAPEWLEEKVSMR